MFDRTCGTCGKNFKSQRKDSATCYGCALTQLIGNGAPEESDFNTALLTSGEMSDEDAYQLQRDLESIDHSAEEEFERSFDGWNSMEDDYDDWNDE